MARAPIEPRRGALYGLTEGAILAALVAVLALATRYIPVLGIATAYLCPLPLSVLAIRRGLRLAVMASVVAAGVAAMLAGPVAGASILIAFAPMGITIGLGALRGWPASRIVLLATVMSAISTGLSLFGLLGGEATTLSGMAAQMRTAIEQSVASTARLYSRFGVSGAQGEAALAPYRQILPLLPYLLPAILLAGAAFAAWLNYEVGRRVLGRLGYTLPPLPPIRAWRVPAMVVWLLPIGTLLWVFGARPGTGVIVGPFPPPEVLRERLPADLPLLAGVGLGITVSLQMLFVLQGLVVAWVIMGNLELTNVERTIAIALTVSFSTAVPLLSTAIFLLGLLDSVLRVRERWGIPRDRQARTSS